MPYSLGLGNNQKVCEEEEVSLLGLQACLQLHVAIKEERPVVAHEGLHKGTCLWADGGEAAFPANGNRGNKGNQLTQMSVSEDWAETVHTHCKKQMSEPDLGFLHYGVFYLRNFWIKARTHQHFFLQIL